jgi:hypothetical protein
MSGVPLLSITHNSPTPSSSMAIGTWTASLVRDGDEASEASLAGTYGATSSRKGEVHACRFPYENGKLQDAWVLYDAVS